VELFDLRNTVRGETLVILDSSAAPVFQQEIGHAAVRIVHCVVNRCPAFAVWGEQRSQVKLLVDSFADFKCSLKSGMVQDIPIKLVSLMDRL
jgi:hypothetical protein